MSGRFPDTIIALAQASGKRCGVFPSVILAQWALESSYGTRMSGRNNPFGIKARAGQSSTLVTTHEQNAAGQEHVERDGFANFASIADSFDGHASLMLTSRYLPVRAAKTPEDAAAELRDCGYATDVKYPSKLISIMDQNALYQYDAAKSAPTVTIDAGLQNNGKPKPSAPYIPPVTAPPHILPAPAKPASKPKVAAGAVVVASAGTAVVAAQQGHTGVWVALAIIAVITAGIGLAIHFRKG